MEQTATPQPTGPGDTLTLYLMYIFNLRVGPEGNEAWIKNEGTPHPAREISNNDFHTQVYQYFEHWQSYIENLLVKYKPAKDGDFDVYARDNIEMSLDGFDLLYMRTVQRLNDFFEVTRVMGPPPTTFRGQLEHLINFHNLESGSDTPDHILADYLVGCLDVFDKTLAARERWYGRELSKNETINLLDPEPANG